MKKSAQYMKQIKQLASTLKKEKGKGGLSPLDDPMRALLLGILSTYASETRAEAALARLMTAVVDLNEVRVTSVAELVGYLGADFPSVRPAAEEISRALSAVFNRTHRVDLEHLKDSPRKTTEAFLEALDGVGAHAKAMVVMRSLGGHAVPVDEHMLFFLQRSGCVPEGATAEEAQKLLAAQISERDAGWLYSALKRHAAAHTPRKLPPGKVPTPAAPPPEALAAKPPGKPELKGQPPTEAKAASKKLAPAVVAAQKLKAAKPGQNKPPKSSAPGVKKGVKPVKPTDRKKK